MSHEYFKNGDAIDYANGGTAIAAGDKALTERRAAAFALSANRSTSIERIGA